MNINFREQVQLVMLGLFALAAFTGYTEQKNLAQERVVEINNSEEFKQGYIDFPNTTVYNQILNIKTQRSYEMKRYCAGFEAAQFDSVQREIKGSGV